MAWYSIVIKLCNFSNNYISIKNINIVINNICLIECFEDYEP